MRIIYLTNARIPTEKAHGIATVKLCEAFAKNGVEVTLIVPWRVNSLREDPYIYYGVERNFAITSLPSLDLMWLGVGERFFFLLQLFSFSVVAALWLFIRYYFTGGLKNTIIFSHDHVPLFFVSFFAPNIFYDVHHFPAHSPWYARVLKKARGIAVQTKWKIGELAKEFGVPENNIVYWPNGTDIKRFDAPLSLLKARDTLQLPHDRKIVLYTGSLQSWKGVDTLIKAAEFLPKEVVLYMVGGSPRDIHKFSIQHSAFSIEFVGQQPWAEIPAWLKAADVVVLPNTGKEKVSRHYTSPMKLFEYMASGRPIVASDIPSIREIVDDSMVFFAKPDDPQSFAKEIQYALFHPEEAQQCASRACEEVKKYTWDARAERILSSLRYKLVAA